jgi:acetyl-CoA synthetase (ADP-forming)
MVGAGGTHAELIRDVEVTLAPLSAETAASMLKRLRIWPLLEGFRGYPARDVGAAIAALVKLGQLASALEGRLLELDINPLLVRGKGEGAVAADARAMIA